MLARAFARCVAAALMALVIATLNGTQGAHGAADQKPGVKRLWSQFPLGPPLRIPPASQTRHRQPPPATSASTGTDNASPRTGSAQTAESRRVPTWLWALIAVAAVVLISAACWLWARRRAAGRSSPRVVIPDRPRPPARVPAEPVQASASTPPDEKHPWRSAGPRSLETLPRRELFDIANALGIENTVLMSREELIEALRPSGPVTSTTAAKASDLEVARHAAMYVAACRAGNPAPIIAVSATVSPTTEDPAGYSKRMVAEARRRGLLTSDGRGKPGGQLTARSKILLRQAVPGQPESPRR